MVSPSYFGLPHVKAMFFTLTQSKIAAEYTSRKTKMAKMISEHRNVSTMRYQREIVQSMLVRDILDDRGMTLNRD